MTSFIVLVAIHKNMKGSRSVIVSSLAEILPLVRAKDSVLYCPQLSWDLVDTCCSLFTVRCFAAEGRFKAFDEIVYPLKR